MVQHVGIRRGGGGSDEVLGTRHSVQSLGFLLHRIGFGDEEDYRSGAGVETSVPNASVDPFLSA